LQTSFAGFERFWIFSKSANKKSMKRGMIYLEKNNVHYQTLSKFKENPTDQSVDLQQRMEWFTQLPEKKSKKCVMFGKNENSGTK
jgi:hypothetical protein